MSCRRTFNSRGKGVAQGKPEDGAWSLKSGFGATPGTHWVGLPRKKAAEELKWSMAYASEDSGWTPRVKAPIILMQTKVCDHSLAIGQFFH